MPLPPRLRLPSSVTTSRSLLRRAIPPTTRAYSLSGARKATPSQAKAAPESTEYSQSGRGDAGAASTRTAFDPGATAPETQERGAAAEAGKVSMRGASRGFWGQRGSCGLARVQSAADGM